MTCNYVIFYFGLIRGGGANVQPPPPYTPWIYSIIHLFDNKLIRPAQIEDQNQMIIGKGGGVKRTNTLALKSTYIFWL